MHGRDGGFVGRRREGVAGLRRTEQHWASLARTTTEPPLWTVLDARPRRGLCCWTPSSGVQGCEGVDGAGLANLRGLSELRSLSLNRTDVGDSDLRTLTESHKLTLLALEGCEGVTDAGLKIVGQMRNLRILALDGSRGNTDVGLEHL